MRRPASSADTKGAISLAQRRWSSRLKQGQLSLKVNSLFDELILRKDISC